MFNKIKNRILTLEVVLDALIQLLHDRDVVKRDEIQMEILSKAGEPYENDWEPERPEGAE